jgi:drug/metabolite transporter (DMT)-like permease
MTQISAGVGSMIQASGPIMVAVLSHFAFAEERLTRARIGGAIVGFAGIGILIGPKALDSADAGFLGVMAMLATAVSYAVGNIYVRFIREAVPARLAFGQQLFSAGPRFSSRWRSSAPGPSRRPWACRSRSSGSACSARRCRSCFSCASSAPPAPPAPRWSATSPPVSATILAMVFLGEHIGLRELVGGMVVLAGVYVVSTARRA